MALEYDQQPALNVIEIRPQAFEHSLPSLEAFPAKIRPHIEQGHAIAQEALYSAQRVVNTWHSCQKNIPPSQEHQLSEQQRIRVTQRIQALDQELDALVRSQHLLQEGKDAFDALNIRDSATLVALHQRYGDTLKGHITSILSRAEYKIGRAKYHTHLIEYFNFRLVQLKRLVIAPLTEQPIPPAVVLMPHDKKVTLMASALEQGDATQLAETRNQYQTIEQATSIRHSLAELQSTQTAQWVEKHSAELTSLTPIGTQDTRTALEEVTKVLPFLATTAQQLGIDHQSAQTHLNTFDHNLSQTMVRSVSQKIREFTQAYHLPPRLYGNEIWIGNCPLSSCGVPHEALHVLDEFVELLRSLAATSSGIDTSLITQQATALAQFRQSIDLLQTTNERFVESQDILWHMGSVNSVLADILQRGLLASRAAQLEHFGETKFSSSTIVSLTKDGITLRSSNDTPEFLTWDQFAVRRAEQPNIVSKDPLQELHQICFSSNYPYLQDGVALVFDQASLMSKSQFMSSDGYHLFDPGYHSENPESPGFEVNLLTEPFVLVGLRAQEQQIRAQITQALSTPPWQIDSPNLEGWMTTHILFIESYADTTEVKEKAPVLLRQQHLESIQSGFFVPTGESGESAVRAQRGLYRYQCDEEKVRKNEP